MRRQRLITVLIMSLWVLAGPLALVCASHCTVMGTPCAPLCAPPTGVVPTLPRLTLTPYNTVQVPHTPYHIAPLANVPTPPPKDSSISV